MDNYRISKTKEGKFYIKRKVLGIWISNKIAGPGGSLCREIFPTLEKAKKKLERLK